MGLEEMPWDSQEIQGRWGPPVSCEPGHLPKTVHFILKDRKEGVCLVPTSRTEGSVLWAPHASSDPAVDLGLFSSVGNLSFWTQLGPSDISCPGPKPLAFIRVRRESVLPSGDLLGGCTSLLTSEGPASLSVWALPRPPPLAKSRALGKESLT